MEIPKANNNGGIAQLGVHQLCKQGVIGSIPIISTSRVSEDTEGSSERQRSRTGLKTGS